MWELLMIGRVLIAFVLFQIVLKKTLVRNNKLPQAQKSVLIAWQFIGASALSAAYLVVVKTTGLEGMPSQFNYLWVLVSVIGIFNAYGVYCQWRAVDISLSKASMLTQFDDVIALLIGILLLREKNLLNSQMTFGIICCFAAAFIIASGKLQLNRQLLGWVTKYSVIWGVAFASYRYFNLKQLPASEFLICWYLGTTASAWLIALYRKFIRHESISFKLEVENKRSIPLLSIFIWSSMLFGYGVAYYAPVAVYQPVLLVAEAVIPSIIGLYYFHEREKMTAKERGAILLGLTGTIIMAVSY